MDFPFFDNSLPELDQFIVYLVELYRAGNLNTWEDLDKHVNIFFTAERMAETEAMVPGWKRMSSFSDGITLTHVTCVFLGLFLLPEFQKLTREQQQLAKWIVLFHDVEKERIQGKKDLTHGFRGAAYAAKTLANLKFPVSDKFANLIDSWCIFTCNSIVHSDVFFDYIQDNSKLPEIISGIDKLFEKDSAASLIVKSVLLHMSISVVKDFPQTAPLTTDEINLYVNEQLLPLLKIMMLSDNEGWSLFDPEVSLQQRIETIAAFEEIEKARRKTTQ